MRNDRRRNVVNKYFVSRTRLETVVVVVVVYGRLPASFYRPNVPRIPCFAAEKYVVGLTPDRTPNHWARRRIGTTPPSIKLY